MKIILISNYPGDKQVSMLKYALALRENLLRHKIEVEIIYPQSFFVPKNKPTTHGIFKWLGYLDKYIVFPFNLKRKVLLEAKDHQKDVFFHICDHSNSMYLKFLPRKTSGITCHDVLAIQGALGVDGTYCKSSKTGILLQKWILRNLNDANVLTTVSHNTMNHLLQLCGIEKYNKSNWKVIHNTFNSRFWPMDIGESSLILKNKNFSEKPFILNVGSNLPRKNRGLLLRMVHDLGKRWNGNICFAGDPLDKDFFSMAEQLGLKNRLISFNKPDHKTLVALYSSCEAFIFPSFSEGFGWPLIEAQACGAPVIASSIPTLFEIGGEAAIYADPNRPEEFAECFLKLLQKENRIKQVFLGFENCKRYSNEKLTRDFIRLYQKKHTA